MGKSWRRSVFRSDFGEPGLIQASMGQYCARRPLNKLRVVQRPGRHRRIRKRWVPMRPWPSSMHQCDAKMSSFWTLESNSGTAPGGITPFHFNDGVDEFFLRSSWARSTPALGRKQHAVLSSPQHIMEMQQVEGFRTMAERRTRAGRMKRVHKPAMMRSAARRMGARLRPRLRIRS